MKHFPEHSDRPHLQPEREIISRVITSALKAGYMVSVHDGEEYGVQRTTDRAKIEAECFATDATTFILRRPNGDRIGFVWFIHGNEWDVISDYSDNEETETVLAPAFAYIERSAA